MDRIGACEKQHAQVYVKSKIKVWAKDRESFGAFNLSEEQIAQIVAEQFKAIIEGNAQLACEFVDCEDY